MEAIATCQTVFYVSACLQLQRTFGRKCSNHVPITKNIPSIQHKTKNIVYFLSNGIELYLQLAVLRTVANVNNSARPTSKKRSRFTGGGGSITKN